MSGPDLGVEGVTDAAEIGRGGFGVVYRATETDLGRSVAVKVLPTALDEAARKRFDRERKAMGALSNHPHIVTVHRSGFTASGDPYLVMEFLEGGSLADLLRVSGRLPWERVRRIGIEIAEALATAHRNGVLHRDIKPGNIMLTDDGVAKLGDFGIARLHSSPDTRSAVVTASVAHAPPEVLAGAKPDARADLYSLASTLFELAHGQPAFTRAGEESLLPMINRIASMPVPDMADLGVPTAAGAVIARAMAKDPEDRHPDLRTFADALRALEGAPIGHAPGPASPPVGSEPQPTAFVAATSGPVPSPAAFAAPSPGPAAPAAAFPTPAPQRSNLGLWAVVGVLTLLVGAGIAAIATQGGSDEDGAVTTLFGAEGEGGSTTPSTAATPSTAPSTIPSSTPPPTTVPPTTVPPTTVPPTTNLAQGPIQVLRTSTGSVQAVAPAVWTDVETDDTSIYAAVPESSVPNPDAWIPGFLVLHFSAANGYEPSGINQNQLMDEALAGTSCTERERHFYDNGRGLTGTYAIADTCDGVPGQSVYLVAGGAADDSYATAIVIAYPTGDDSVVFSILDSLEFS